MIVRSCRRWWLLIPFCALFACGTVSDTGFSGGWTRTGQDDRSLLSIWQENGKLQFVVNRYVEGHHQLRCTRDGECAYFEGNAPYFKLEFKVRDDSDDQTLLIDCRGYPLEGHRGTPVQWVERVSVAEDGLALEVQRIELNGKSLEGMPRRFEKTSNGPVFR